jgi:hypothetical protein
MRTAVGARKFFLYKKVDDGGRFWGKRYLKTTDLGAVWKLQVMLSSRPKAISEQATSFAVRRASSWDVP